MGNKGFEAIKGNGYICKYNDTSTNICISDSSNASLDKMVRGYLGQCMGFEEREGRQSRYWYLSGCDHVDEITKSLDMLYSEYPASILYDMSVFFNMKEDEIEEDCNRVFPGNEKTLKIMGFIQNSLKTLPFAVPVDHILFRGVSGECFTVMLISERTWVTVIFSDSPVDCYDTASAITSQLERFDVIREMGYKGEITRIVLSKYPENHTYLPDDVHCFIRRKLPSALETVLKEKSLDGFESKKDVLDEIIATPSKPEAEFFHFEVTPVGQTPSYILESKFRNIRFKDDHTNPSCAWNGTFAQLAAAISEKGINEFSRMIQCEYLKTSRGRSNDQVNEELVDLDHMLKYAESRLETLGADIPDVPVIIGYPMNTCMIGIVVFVGDMTYAFKYAEGDFETHKFNEDIYIRRMKAELINHTFFQDNQTYTFRCKMLWNSIDMLIANNGVSEDTFFDSDGFRDYLTAEYGKCRKNAAQVNVYDFLSKELKPKVGYKDIVNQLWVDNKYVDDNNAIRSTMIYPALDFVESKIHEAKEKSCKYVIMLTGIPGAGKTYVGLRTVKDVLADEGLCDDADEDVSSAYYMTGNYGLYAVMNSEFLRVHDSDSQFRPIRFLKDMRFNGGPQKCKAHVVVYDESQRIKDEQYMMYYARQNRIVDDNVKSRSQAELLLESLSDLDWCVLLLLVGSNQELSASENNYIECWNKAFKAEPSWKVYASPMLHGLENVECVESLHLDNELRSIESSRKSSWFKKTLAKVEDFLHLPNYRKRIKEIDMKHRKFSNIDRFTDSLLFDECFDEAKKAFNELSANAFKINVVKHIDDVRRDITEVGKEDSNLSYGFIASGTWFGNENASQSLDYMKEHKIETKFANCNAGPEVRTIEEWFDPTSMTSCRKLDAAPNEYFVQGLELDYPILIWRNDLLRKDDEWVTNRYEKDLKYLKNSYKVLLTRARYGLYILVPSTEVPELEETYEYLKSICSPM